MARRRHRRSFRGRKESKLNKMLVPSSFLVSFLQQLTEKDVQASSTFNALDPVSKGKFLLGDAVGRMTGFYPFANLTGSHAFAPNPTGFINKWTGLGLGGWLVSKYLPIPFKSQIHKVSKGFIGGGIIGGVFDAPPGQHANQPLQASQVGSGNSAVQSGSMLA